MVPVTLTTIPTAGKYPRDHAARPEKHLKWTDPFNSHGQLGKEFLPRTCCTCKPRHGAPEPPSPCPGPCKEQTAGRRLERWPPRFRVPELQSSTSPRGRLMNKELPRRPLLLGTSWEHRMRRSPSSGVSPDRLADSRQQAGKGRRDRQAGGHRQGLASTLGSRAAKDAQTPGELVPRNESGQVTILERRRTVRLEHGRGRASSLPLQLGGVPGSKNHT